MKGGCKRTRRMMGKVERRAGRIEVVSHERWVEEDEKSDEGNDKNERE